MGILAGLKVTDRVRVHFQVRIHTAIPRHLKGNEDTRACQ